MSKRNSQRNGLLARRAALGADVSRAKRASRNWTFERLEDRQLLSANAFHEPLFGEQWHLLNTGQQVGNYDFQEIYAVAGEDLNVVPAWDLVTGAGVKVAVAGGVFETDHPDLANTYDPDLQFDLFEGDFDTSAAMFVPGDEGDPDATAIAGIIAAGANGEGITGVAYNATIVPVRVVGLSTDIPTDPNLVELIELWTEDIDIFNHSWEDSRANLMTTPLHEALNDSAIFGRDGLGVIHVQAAGDGADEGGFANSSRWANSRFVITVTGTDHTGGYNNVDGTVTNYAEVGPGVMVAAPSGSLTLVEIINDTKIGSAITTTDFTGNNGHNQARLPSGLEIDNDFLEDADYTSRFSGTDASAAMVSGVVALMLEANSDLSWRDVQEILIRSARQNAPDEKLATGLEKNRGLFHNNTWIINPVGLFRPVTGLDAATVADIVMPLTDPALDTAAFGATPDGYTNGAGYTISQGTGSYGETIGYAHGVVDAELAVLLARQWHVRDPVTGELDPVKSQALPTELTYTTYISGGPTIEAGGEVEGQSIPGKLGDPAEFIGFYECIVDADCELADYLEEGNPVPNFTGKNFIDLGTPPPENAMRVEWIELKLRGSADNLGELRLTLVSPDGTHSELNNYGTSLPIETYGTNRHWGERFDSDPPIDPATGEPYPDVLPNTWQLHAENNSGAAITLGEIEVVWHGSRIDPLSRRIQGAVGVDDNDDEAFNFQRWVQLNVDLDEDGLFNRKGEVQRELDPNQESFASNITVKLLDSSGELVDQFITGADGNFYFDVDPTLSYTIEIEDPEDRTALDDDIEDFLPKYKTSWEITPDWFAAIDHERGPDGFNPSSDYDIPLDPDDPSKPLMLPLSEQTDVRGINFLLEAATSDPHIFEGLVFADVDGNGTRDNQDEPQPGVTVFADLNGSGALDFIDLNGNSVWDSAKEPREPEAQSQSDGTYSLNVPTEFNNIFEIMAAPPAGWTQTLPETGSYTKFSGPGMINKIPLNFGMQPPPSERELRVTGLVFADTNEDGMMNAFESGQGGVQVYADLNGNDSHDPAYPDNEPSTFSAANGFHELTIPTLAPLSFEVRVVVGADGSITTPEDGEISVTGSAGDIRSQANFGIKPSATLAGRISGSVFHDNNGNGLRDRDDFGVPGFTVYLDGDKNGDWTTGERQAITDAGGNFLFSGVAPGDTFVRMNTSVEWDITTPDFDHHAVSVTTAGYVSGLEFGVNNLPIVQGVDVVGGVVVGGGIGTLEFGDLLGFPTALAQNGPYHQTVPGFQLGSFVDSELDGQPHSHGLGDDTNGIPDDDGVQIIDAAGRSHDVLGNPIAISPGNNRAEVVVAGMGGRLNGWMDFDGSGSFDKGEHIFNNIQLRPGRYVLPFNAPGNLAKGSIAARFRWGEADLSFTGGSLFAGEVEDYMFETANGLTVTAQTGSGDYDGDGIVGPDDYNVWRNSFGSTTELAADGNGNGTIDAADYTIWRENTGLVIGVGIVSAVTDSDSLEEAEEELTPTTLVIGPLAPSVDVTAGDTNVVAATSSSAGEVVDDDLLNLVLGQLGSQSDEGEDSTVLETSHADADDFDLALAVVLGEETDWRLL